MARNCFSYEINLNPNANPFTMLAIVPPSAQDAVLNVVEFFPEGVSASGAPLQFVLWKGDNTTNLADDSARIRKVNRFSGPAVQTKIYKNNGAGEPGVTETLHEARLNIHEQVPGSMLAKNAYREFVIPAGEIWLIRSIGAQGIATTVRVNLEE